MQLNEFQRDAIIEVMMIGAGHASTAMAKILKKEVDIKIPSIELCPIDNVPKKIGRLETLTIGVYTEIKGDLRGRLLTVFSRNDALRLESMILGKKVQKLKDVSTETITHLADILALSNLGAISDFFEIETERSHSEMAYDMIGALLEQVLLDISQHSEIVLFSKTDIFISSEKFNCNQILFLEQSSLEFLLKELESKYD